MNKPYGLDYDGLEMRTKSNHIINLAKSELELERGKCRQLRREKRMYQTTFYMFWSVLMMETLVLIYIGWQLAELARCMA